MKKVLLALAVVVCTLAAMTSCTSKNYCYKVTEKYEKWDSDKEDWQSKSNTYYDYCTPRCINVQISEKKKEYKRANYRKIKITKKKVDKSESDCEAMNYPKKNNDDYYYYNY